MGTGMSKTHRAGQQLGNPEKISISLDSEFLPSQKSLIFAVMAFSYLNEAHPLH